MRDAFVSDTAVNQQLRILSLQSVWPPTVCTLLVVAWVGVLFSGLSEEFYFVASPVVVTFVVDVLALGRVPVRALRFDSVGTFHQCSISIPSSPTLYNEKI